MAERLTALQRALETSHTGYGLLKYLLYLGIDPEQLHGPILDIGSGGNTFAQELSKINEDAFVVSLNPHLLLPEVRLESKTAENNEQVIALAQGSLPFADNSFRIVVSLLGVPKNLLANEVPPFLEETWRILQPGGIGYFYPLACASQEDGSLSLAQFRDRISIEKIPKNLWPVSYKSDPRVQRRLIMRKS